MFPLSQYLYQIPELPCPGAFAAVRKYDIHTGVDLYCMEGSLVKAMYDGVVTAILPFTGALAESPWWHDTEAIMIYSRSLNQTILYGEVRPHVCLRVGDLIPVGTIIGEVARVLKTDKGVVPSTTMLHMELYEGRISDCVWWKHNETQPTGLLDVSHILRKELE